MPRATDEAERALLRLYHEPTRRIAGGIAVARLLQQ
jgi:hypothetical protein